MEDVQQGAAIVAAPQLSAECFGSASDDVGDGATMRWQHRRTMSRQIAGPETAENVRHLGHASEAAHHLIEQRAQRGPRRFRQVGIYRRRGDALVAEKHLNNTSVHLLLEEPSCIGVSEGVRRRPSAAGEVRRLDGIGEGADQDIGGDRTGPPAVGKEPAPVAVVFCLPHSAKALMDRPWHGNDPFLVALADHPQEAAGLVDSGDRKSGGLADAQAAGIDQAETATVYRVTDAIENAPNFGVGERLRQPFLLRKPDLFLNRAQSLPSVFR